MTRFARPLPAGLDHLDELAAPLAALRAEAPRLEAWGAGLAGVLGGGGRLLAAGNGGSAAQAAHLTAELVGRYRDDRPPFSAIALISEPCALSAIGNDYGAEQIFARQVEGHGRTGDVLLCLSTSGRSRNLLTAVEAARRCGLETWALCGRPGSPLERMCDEALCVDAPHTATVQEIHLIAVHLLCAAFEHALARAVAPLGLAEAG
jgi:D-sedoheptulose 7-phosphate isomerase